MSANPKQMKTSIFRVEHFNAAHRLHNNGWSEARNREVFGKCNNPNYHGHNYELEVRVSGMVDPDTGYVIDTKELSAIIQEEVLERLDHKNLNLDVAEFSDLNPTAENMAYVIYGLLRKRILSTYDLKIKLYETARNYVEYPAG
jgi:6-pyruvoyltetrahydropterin/6-carboxytetrahydropterin synthase